MGLILHTRRRVLRAPVVLFVAAAGTAFVLSLAGLLGYVPLSDVAPIAVVTTPQIFAGSVLWIRVTRGRDLSWPEVLGVGLVLGPTLFAVVSLALRLATNAGPRLVALAALGVLVLLGLGLSILNVQDNGLNPLPRRDWAPIFVALPLATVVLRRYWRNVELPLQIDGWGTLGGDAAFDVASSKSIAILGLSDRLLFAGQPFKYHFLSQAWAGFTDAAINASPFVVVTRTAPLLLSVGILLLIWAWIRIAAANRTAAWLALAVSVTGGFIYVGAVLTPVSLTQMWGSALALVVVLIFTRCLMAPSLHLRLLLVGMAIPMVMAKSTTIILLPALVVGAMTVRDRYERSRLTWASVAALAVGSFTLLIFAYGYGGGSGLYLSTTQTAEYLGLSAFHVPVVILLLVLSWVLATPWLASINTLWLDNQVSRCLVSASVSLAVVAMLSTSLTGHGGQSQIYFIVTAAAILVPMSAWGVTTALPILRALPFLLQLLWGATLISASSIWFVSLRSYSWAGLSIAILLSLLVTTFARKAQIAGWHLGRLSWVAATATLSLSFFIATGIINWSILLIPGPQAPTIGPSNANSISRGQISAIRELEELNPERELVASNFLCDRPEALPPDCFDLQVPVAALAGQRMLVEGSSYSVTEETRILAQDLRQLQHSFSVAPDTENLVRLWDLGVRWLFVDRRRTSVNDWRPFGEVVVENPDAFIVRLDAPA